MHILIAISGHGYGHLSQTAPVINALFELGEKNKQNICFTVVSSLPSALLNQRILPKFKHINMNFDFGMRMKDALHVDVKASYRRYKQVHKSYAHHVEGAATLLKETCPDLVLANIPYVLLSACQQRNVSHVALCSLNWADIFHHYYAQHVPAIPVWEQIQAAYESVSMFIQPTPSMPMCRIRRRHQVGLIAETGYLSQRDVYRKQLIGADQYLILVALGGIDYRMDLEDWPYIEGVTWVFNQAVPAIRQDMLSLQTIPLSFQKILCASDLLMTKPGYGSFAEAAALGLPVLYLPRPDWPEAVYLTQWAESNMLCEKVDNISTVEFKDQIMRCLQRGRSRPVAPTGGMQAAQLLYDLGYHARTK